MVVKYGVELLKLTSDSSAVLTTVCTISIFSIDWEEQSIETNIIWALSENVN